MSALGFGPMVGVPPLTAPRLRILLLALGAALVPPAVAATPQSPVTLLSPGNGTLVSGLPSFKWRVDTASSGPVTVTHQVAADLAFTQEVTTTTRTCPGSNLNCWTGFQALRPSSGRRYWRVSLSGAVSASSPTWMFVGTTVRTGPDRARPTVRAYSGRARRGRKAVFVARVADDRGEARLRVDFLYRNQLVFRAMTLLKPVRWTVRQRFDSRAPLPRSLQPGTYRLCVTAWDRTGNQARSCARYVVN